jgi:hypothetical protein
LNPMLERGSHLCAGITALLLLTNVGLSQNSLFDRIPTTRTTVDASESVHAYRLSPDARALLDLSDHVVIRLPALNRKAAPTLFGMLPAGAGIEIFLGWMDPERSAEGFEHHIEVLSGARGSEAALLRDIVLYGGPGATVGFFQPPGAAVPPTVLIDIQGGAYWGTTYLLSQDRQSAERIFSSTDYQFADLDGDGSYELIAWNRRPFDIRCNFGIFAVRFYPEVFVSAGGRYRRAWPPPDWAPPDFQFIDRMRSGEKEGVPWGAKVQVLAGFATGRENSVQLVVLQDRFVGKPEQSLAIYKFENQRFQLVAEEPLPPQRIAYLLSGPRDSGNGKEILIETATPDECEAGGDPKVIRNGEAVYILRGNRLQRVQR